MQSFPIDQLPDHENICGRKKVNCPVCAEVSKQATKLPCAGGIIIFVCCFQEVSQLELEMHLEAFHAVETESIDWSRPIVGQVCVCCCGER